MRIIDKIEKYRKILEDLEEKARNDSNNDKLLSKIKDYKYTIMMLELQIDYER